MRALVTCRRQVLLNFTCLENKLPTHRLNTFATIYYFCEEDEHQCDVISDEYIIEKSNSEKKREEFRQLGKAEMLLVRKFDPLAA